MTLTAPANGSSYTAPASMALAASASDPEGNLAKVEFYRGSTLLGTDTTSPFSYTWSSVAAGTYSLTAVAYDTAGLKTTSSAATVTVGTATNKPPIVTLTAPSSGANFTAPASISFAATTSDPEGKLAKVEFYQGSTLLGTDTSSPFSYTWLCRRRELLADGSGIRHGRSEGDLGSRSGHGGLDHDIAASLRGLPEIRRPRHARHVVSAQHLRERRESGERHTVVDGQPRQADAGLQR